MDAEELVEARQLEHLEDLRPDVAHLQAAVAGGNLAVQLAKEAEHRARHELDVAKIEEHVGAGRLASRPPISFLISSSTVSSRIFLSLKTTMCTSPVLAVWMRRYKSMRLARLRGFRGIKIRSAA